jgi:hypothetical protein
MAKGEADVWWRMGVVMGEMVAPLGAGVVAEGHSVGKGRVAPTDLVMGERERVRF